MPFEPDWSKIFSHSSVTNQLREYHRQIAPYLDIALAYSQTEPPEPLEEGVTECQNDTSQDEDPEKQE